MSGYLAFFYDVSTFDPLSGGVCFCEGANERAFANKRYPGEEGQEAFPKTPEPFQEWSLPKGQAGLERCQSKLSVVG